MSQKKVIPKKATPAKKKPKLPKVLELRIRLLVRWPEPDAEGRWAFTAALPRQGVPAFTIKAKTAKEARRVLEDYIYNELDCRDDVVADD